jgi:hypothetical protein
VTLKLDLEASAADKAPSERPQQKPKEVRRGRPGATPPGPGSWWTARATTGEVKAGFTKEEILRRPEADPRAEGGMFARLEGLLRALSLEGPSGR